MQIHVKKILKNVKSNIKLCIKSLNIMFVLIHDIFLRNYIKKNVFKYPETAYQLLDFHSILFKFKQQGQIHGYPLCAGGQEQSLKRLTLYL